MKVDSKVSRPSWQINAIIKYHGYEEWLGIDKAGQDLWIEQIRREIKCIWEYFGSIVKWSALKVEPN